MTHKDFFKSMKNPMKLPIPFLMPLADSVGLPEAHVAFLECFQDLENAPKGRLHLSRAWKKATGEHHVSMQWMSNQQKQQKIDKSRPKQLQTSGRHCDRDQVHTWQWIHLLLQSGRVL